MYIRRDLKIATFVGRILDFAGNKLDRGCHRRQNFSFFWSVYACEYV